MEVFQAIILGVIQGLTEFLPISSSGHLVLVQQLFTNFSQPGILFDVILHLGTLAAVSFYFRKKILKLTPRYILLLVIGTIPAVVMGLLFRKEFENLFANPKFLGFEFLITAAMNFLIDKKVSIKNDLGPKNALIIGAFQAAAILPAISRSGATIFAAVKNGIDKKTAAEYSFLLSIPAIIGANLLEIFSYKESFVSEFNSSYLFGFAAAFIVGFLSIDIVIKFLKENKFKLFGYYCLVLGLIILIF